MALVHKCERNSNVQTSEKDLPDKNVLIFGYFWVVFLIVESGIFIFIFIFIN